MEILEYVEQEDGSALLTLELTDEEQRLFIERGIIASLEDKIKEEIKKKK